MIKKNILLLFSVLVLSLAVGYAVFGQWVEPGQPPPGGFTDNLLNTGPTAQTKQGDLGAARFFDKDDSNWFIDPFGFGGDSAVLRENVGIGISPAVKLDIDSNSNTSALRIRGVNANNDVADFYISPGGDLVLDTTKAGGSGRYIDLRSDDNQYGLIIRESNGTAVVPYANLYVKDSADDYLSVRLNKVYNAPGQGLVITNSDRVGIGTNAPAYNLEVQSTADSALFLEADTDNSGETDNAFIKLSQDNALVQAILGTLGNAGFSPENVAYSDTLTNATLLGTLDANGALQFGTNDAVRMTIDKDGDVGIGTNNPGADKLRVVGGPINAEGGLRIERRSSDVPGGAGNVGRIWICTDNDGTPYDCVNN